MMYKDYLEKNHSFDKKTYLNQPTHQHIHRLLFMKMMII